MLDSVESKLANIPFLCAHGGHGKVGSNKDGSAGQGQIYHATLWSSDDGQEGINGDLAGVMGAK